MLSTNVLGASVLFFLFLATLPGQASLSLDPASGSLTGSVSMRVPAGASLKSYLAALQRPYQPNDVDRLWDYPGAPDGSHFVWKKVSVEGRVVEPDAPLPAGLLFAEFSARVPQRYGALRSRLTVPFITHLCRFLSSAKTVVRCRSIGRSRYRPKEKVSGSSRARTMLAIRRDSCSRFRGVAFCG